jgi:hypothetical protein
MATVTRRFFYKGPWPLYLKGALDPTLTLPAPKYVVSYDITYDDAVPDAATVDATMRQYGCFPDTVNTISVSPAPFLGVISPDGSIWMLAVSDLGVLTPVKVSP